jgi:hypothetical protein
LHNSKIKIMLDKIQQINDTLGINVVAKSKIFKDRYVRLCFYRDMIEKGHSINDIKHVLKVNKTDIRRYPKQIEKIIGTELFAQSELAYKNMDRSLLTQIFSKNSPLRADTPIGTYPSRSEIPYSIMDVIDIMKPHRNFESPLWDKDLISYTLEDWEEIEMLKLSQQRIDNSIN